MNARGGAAKGEGPRPTLTGGPALKQAIHVARARTELTSDMQLSLRSGVSYDTLMNWYGDRTTPRPAEVKRVADTLGISYSILMAAWEGRDPEPPALQDAIRELVEEMRLSRAQQDESTQVILRALAALLDRDPAPAGTPGDSGPGVTADRT